MTTLLPPRPLLLHLTLPVMLILHLLLKPKHKCKSSNPLLKDSSLIPLAPLENYNLLCNQLFREPPPSGNQSSKKLSKISKVSFKLSKTPLNQQSKDSCPTHKLELKPSRANSKVPAKNWPRISRDSLPHLNHQSKSWSPNSNLTHKALSKPSLQASRTVLRSWLETCKLQSRDSLLRSKPSLRNSSLIQSPLLKI